MGLRYSAQKHGTCFFVTTTFDGWNRYGDIPGMYERLVLSLQFCLSKYNASLFGFVLMPSHLHLVIGIEGERLGPLMRDFKKFIAQKAAEELGILTSRLWMPRYDRVEITSAGVLLIKLTYIHDNPVKAGLCPDASSWKWSSVHAYSGTGETVLSVFTEWS